MSNKCRSGSPPYRGTLGTEVCGRMRGDRGGDCVDCVADRKVTERTGLVVKVEDGELPVERRCTSMEAAVVSVAVLKT